MSLKLAVIRSNERCNQDTFPGQVRDMRTSTRKAAICRVTFGWLSWLNSKGAKAWKPDSPRPITETPSPGASMALILPDKLALISGLTKGVGLAIVQARKGVRAS